MRKEFKFFFLDRDGVINTNGFVNAPSDFEFIPRSIDALRFLNEFEKRVFVATNQGGIESGYLTEQTLYAIHACMEEQIHAGGGNISKIYHCPHFSTPCECRKPKPGMLIEALNTFNLRHAAESECCFIGDWITDWQAAIAAGIHPIAVQSGRAYDKDALLFIREHEIPVYADLYEAVTDLLP